MAYSSKRAYHITEYNDQIGKYGENPRNRLPHDADKMTNRVHELNFGTTKTANHIPGYQGFLAKSDFNPEAVNASVLKDVPRETWLK